jgi:death on curing protein
LATEEVKYLSYTEAVFIHIELMRLWGESRFGVFDRGLIESALVRPRQAAAYEQANLFQQAASLCFGLIKNHPWVGGNKRTATALTDEFLFRNGLDITASAGEVVAMAMAVESGQWQVDEIAAWLGQHTKPLTE